MISIPQQFSEASRTQLDSQLALYSDFSQTALNCIEKLVHLNIAAMRASMEETSSAAVQLMGARGPGELASLIREQSNPNVGKVIAYSNHLVNIATNAQAEYARAAETQIAEAGRKASRLVEDAAKSAPPGVENMLAMMKSAIGNASSGYEQLNKTTRLAAEALETNTDAAVNEIVQPEPSVKGDTDNV